MTRAEDPAGLRRHISVRIEWLRSAFAAADETYGSFDNYVRDGLGLSAVDTASLRTELLESASGGK